MINLSRLEEIKDLRTVWPHEALDFTPWLSQDDNISLLADAVGLDITIDETESSVGDFNVDIFASETGTDRKIIIENQLEDTNHDHLGKLITYASGKSADVIIWAVKFDVIEKPNDWTKEVKKNESANGTQQQRYDYWVAFQDYVFQNAQFAKVFKRRKPSTKHWMNFSIGSSDCYISVSQLLNKNEINVCLYIPDNMELYESLLANRESIDKAADIPLSWCELPERKASKIIIERPAELSDQSKWKEQFDWLADVMVKIKMAFQKYL